MKQDATIKATRENKPMCKWQGVIETWKKNPAETNRMVTNWKNTMAEPNIKRAKDAALASFPEFSLEKRLRMGDMDPFGIFMNTNFIFQKNRSNGSSYGWE